MQFELNSTLAKFGMPSAVHHNKTNLSGMNGKEKPLY